jgi:hypothetical protein
VACGALGIAKTSKNSQYRGKGDLSGSILASMWATNSEAALGHFLWHSSWKLAAGFETEGARESLRVRRLL